MGLCCKNKGRKRPSSCCGCVSCGQTVCQRWIGDSELELTQAPTVSSYAVNDRATFFSKTTAPATASPVASTLSSLLGTVNSVKPHSKQTASFGNVHTVGLSKPFNPGKWMAISP